MKDYAELGITLKICSLRGEPHTDSPPPPTEKMIPTLSWKTPTLSLHRTPAQNLQREGRSHPRESRDHLYQWDVGISAGSSTETTSSQRNPETRRTPSFVQGNGEEAFIQSKFIWSKVWPTSSSYVHEQCSGSRYTLDN